MSRHSVATKPFEIVVGWDPPLQTFFLQILDPTKNDEQEIVLWLGMQPGELPTVDDLAARSDLEARRLMKVIAFLVASVIGITILPSVNFILARSREPAGNRIRRDAQQKKASFANPVLELEIKHEGGVTAIAFSPDSKILATGADDYTIQLWDARTSQELRRLNEPDRRVRSPGVYPDGQRVYSLAFSPMGRPWRAPGIL